LEILDAGEDAHDALKIAMQTGYIWPKVEALELISAYHQNSPCPYRASIHEKEMAQRHASEAASIKRRLYLTEEEMQELKVKAREEFEKQIAGLERINSKSQIPKSK